MLQKVMPPTVYLVYIHLVTMTTMLSHVQMC